MGLLKIPITFSRKIINAHANVMVGWTCYNIVLSNCNGNIV